MPMEITCRHTSGVRSGVFRTKSGKSMPTPAIVFPADNGTIPHLVSSTISHISPVGGFKSYYTALESFLPMVTGDDFRSENLASYLHPPYSPLHDAISICGLRKAIVSRHYRSSKQAVSAQLNNGSVCQVTPDDYAAAAHRFRPDVLIPIMDLESQSEHVFNVKSNDIPETYLKRRGRRNLSYLKAILAKLPQPETFSVFGVVDGDHEELLNLDSRLCGYVMPFADNPEILELIENLPEDKPRLAIGLSSFDHVLQCLRKGIDLFECSWIIDFSNMGMAFNYKTGTWLMLKDDQFIEDLSPISTSCKCYACDEGRHTRAYIRHLFVIDDLLSYVLITIHNMHQLDAFFVDARDAISAGELEVFLARLTK